ncbi:hypothetical protein [Paenibacillus kribbensis]|uniref:hypothetical protein n=1 Tax=Paenibacillus kribbensis TaxID=172713 RepID=UPI000838A74F|nr:hypothetical protein [Paenibacillus kribbensis]
MDKKAKKILMSTFWSASGWKSERGPFSGEDFEYAKSKGLMFDPIAITHDEIMGRLHELHQQVATKERVTAAFLHSLSTRKVHLRSALSSWALTASLPLHTYEERSVVLPNYSSCGDCNFNKIMSNKEYVNEDLNVLNFERVKWGGVRLNHLLYCWMDLELFCKEEDFEVSDQDIAILHNMLAAVQDCEAQNGARQLEKRWKDVFPSSKHERDVVMEVWGYAGLLTPQETPRRRRHGNDDFNAVAAWQGDDGYSQEALNDYFGTFL